MATTPVYFWPYQALTDPPNGASLGASLALAIEATVQANAAIAAAATVRMGAKLRRVATQSLPDTTFTLVSWDTEDADTDGLFSSGTTITIPSGGDGVWAVSSTVTLVDSPTGLAVVDFNVGGVAQARSHFSNGSTITTVSRVAALSSGSALTINVFADTVAGTTMTAAFECYRVAA